MEVIEDNHIIQIQGKQSILKMLEEVLEINLTIHCYTHNMNVLFITSFNTSMECNKTYCYYVNANNGN